MKLLKVGSRFFNMDLLIEAAIGETTVFLAFASKRDDSIYIVTLARSEATAVADWLRANAEETQVISED